MLRHLMPAIRRASSTDASQLAALAERTFRSTFGSLNTRENMDAFCAKTYGETIQAAEIANLRIETFVCDGDSDLVGYAQLRWRTAPECVVAERPAEIQRIYVDQPYQGKGVAQELMSRLLAAARDGDADRIWLGVWENNLRAQAFYRKLGFNRVGQHVFHLGNDAQCDWILCRHLGNE